MAHRNVKSGCQVESSHFLIEFTHLASSFPSLSSCSSCWVVLAGSVEFSGFEGSGAFADSLSRKKVLIFENEFLKNYNNTFEGITVCLTFLQ